MRSLEQILADDWTLADPSEPAVQWVPRHRNQLADYLSTKTLVRDDSWEHCFSPQILGTHCNLGLFVDGGVRAGKSASAWLIVANLPGHPFVVYKAGGIRRRTFLTPFAAEVAALEAGVAQLALTAGQITRSLNGDVPKAH